MKNKQVIKNCIKVTFFLLFSVFIFHSTAIDAKSKKSKRKFPHGCRALGYGFADKYLILRPQTEEGRQTLYLLHNKSYKPVKLILIKSSQQIHMPSYKNTIKGNQWAAFATDEHEMKFRCINPSNNQSTTLDCSKIFEACQYTRAKFDQGNMGNYWVVKSDPLRRTIYKSILYGILLRW